MIHYSKFIKYHGQMVTLTRISLNDARFFFFIGYDVYIVQDLTEFDKKDELRLLFNANRNQGIKNFDDVCKVFRSHYKVKKSKTLLYFPLKNISLNIISIKFSLKLSKFVLLLYLLSYSCFNIESTKKFLFSLTIL